MASAIRVSSLGRSLPVPVVQEMARGLCVVPPRYQRKDDQDPPIDFHGDSFPSIPVIDMQGLLLSGGDSSSSTTTEYDIELNKLDSACKNWGFFQLVNHGVSLERVKGEVEKFFKLPIEEREKVKQPSGDLQGYGQALVITHEQKLDWSDMVFLVTHPEQERNQNILQKLPISLREALEEYTSEVDELGVTLLEKLATALGMEVRVMRDFFGHVHRGMRLNYYPSCPQPELAVGGSAHSDGVGLTVLIQVNETDGLQVKHGGNWVPVKPLPDAFIVNIGDMLEMFTNGVYHSCEHRVRATSEGERISVARFFSPPREREIVPPSSLVGPKNPPLKYKKIEVEAFLTGFFASPVKGRSYIESMKI
ncbi:hypothetical protein H6P81_004300 [Aristolochia fimbriata]|uniref:Fe2OG dioxygenase domain-containing protein n=1 Tax=Aristolochia fimbriata TaxID=158543 RepID=A0AAV7FHI1_ARIFI|nr:hypothetical protein H6P81_004300 [Aristolochia fimbriata]